jgi:hypothetical protein
MISVIAFRELGRKWLQTHELTDAEVQDIISYLHNKQRAISIHEKTIAEFQAQGLPANFQKRVVEYDEKIIREIREFLRGLLEYDRKNE